MPSVRRDSPRDHHELPTSSEISELDAQPPRPAIPCRSVSEQTTSDSAERLSTYRRTRPRSIDTVTSHQARRRQPAVEAPAEHMRDTRMPQTSTRYRPAGHSSSVKPVELPSIDAPTLNRPLQQPKRRGNTSHVATTSTDPSGILQTHDSQQSRGLHRTMEIGHVPATEGRAQRHVSDTQPTSNTTRVSDTRRMSDQSSMRTTRRPSTLGEAQTSDSINQARPMPLPRSRGTSYQGPSRPSYAETQRRQPFLNPMPSSLNLPTLERPPNTPSPGMSSEASAPSVQAPSPLSEVSDYEDCPRRERQSRFSLRHMASVVFGEDDGSEVSKASSLGRRRRH